VHPRPFEHPHAAPRLHPSARVPFSERDALELADRIESHATLAEKLSFYHSRAHDPELKRLFARFAALISHDVERLTSLLERIPGEGDWNVYSQTEPRLPQDERDCLGPGRR